MPRTPRQLVIAAACCGAAFVALLAVAYATGFGRALDGAGLEGLHVLQRFGTVAPLTELLAALVDPVPYVLFGSALVAIALVRGRPRHALSAAVLLCSTAIASQTLKPLLAYERHQDFLGGAQVESAAFPSGHATGAMALALAAMIVAPPTYRRVVAAAGAVFVALVSFSIISLGWHFPSDVGGGFLLAGSAALLLRAAPRKETALRPERRGRDEARRRPALGQALKG